MSNTLPITKVSQAAVTQEIQILYQLWLPNN